MPKIPTFTSEARPTAEAASVVSNIKIPLNQTVAGALRPLGKAAEDYYIKKKDLENKVEAKKTSLEILVEADEVVSSLKNNPNEEENLLIFNEKINTILNSRLSKTKNKRIQSLIQNTVDLNLPKRISNIKTNSRNSLELDLQTTHKSEQNILAAEYLLSDDVDQKNIILNQAIELEKLYSSDLGVSEIQKNEAIGKIKQTYLITDIDKLINNGQYSEAMNILKNTKNTSFLNTKERMSLIEKTDEAFSKNLAQENIDRAIELGVFSNVKDMQNTDGNKFTTVQAEDSINKNLLKVNQNGEPEFTTEQIIEQGIKNNIKVPAYKNALVAGSANMSDIGNKEKVITGLELYKKFIVTNSRKVLSTTYGISETDLQSYDQLDFATRVLGETFDSALTRVIEIRNGKYKSRLVDDKKIESKINNIDFDNQFRGTFTLGIGSEDIRNTEDVFYLMKNITNLYYKAGGSEDDAIGAAENFLEENYRMDDWNQIVPKDARQPDWHDAAVMDYIKEQYDSGNINTEKNKLKDIIPVYFDFEKYNIQGFVLKNKTTDEPLTLQTVDSQGPAGQFNEFSYGTARFTLEDIKEKIYSRATDERYKQFLIDFNKNKELKEQAKNFGIGEYGIEDEFIRY